MKTRHYLATSVVAYFAFLLYLTPAAPVISTLLKDIQTVSTLSISGSIWNGQASSVRIERYRLEDISWSFSPLALLLGEISYDIDASFEGRPVRSSLALTATGGVTVDDLTASIDAFRVGKIVDIPIGELGGTMDIVIDEASWRSGTVPSIDGRISWQKASVTVADKAELGDITLLLEERESYPLVGLIENVPGQLDIEGKIEVDEEGSYQLNAKLSPNSSASANLRGSLKYVGQPKSDGSYEINNAGNLSTLGLM